MTPEEFPLCTDSVPGNAAPAEGLPAAVRKALRLDTAPELKGSPSHLDLPDTPAVRDKGALHALTTLLHSTSLAARNAANLQRSAAPKGALNSHNQLNTCRFNLVLGYGQSFMQGNHAWPALSTVNKHDNLMLGHCVRPASMNAPAFIAIGKPVFRPLAEKVQSAEDGRLLGQASIAALPAKSGSAGESVLSGALNSLKRLHNDSLLVADDSTRQLVAGNAGVGGRSIEDLSKGAEPALYVRCTDFIRQAKAAANDEGGSCAVSAIFWMQGERNYQRSEGMTRDKDGYKRLLTQLRRDLSEDAAALCGDDQRRPPAFFTYQSGSTHTRDATQLSIGMAQWEFTREQPGCYMVGPTYAYTSSSKHLDANGTRWFGNQIGKVAHRVLTLRQDWRPLAPTAITIDDCEIEIDFNVPEPPLQWRQPYVGTHAIDFPDKGFRLSDSQGSVEILTVQIVADTIVRLMLARQPGAGALLWYASKATHGRGSLCDSDATLAHDCYEAPPAYLGNTQPHAEALVGQPYPLNNWCLAFCLPVPWRL